MSYKIKMDVVEIRGGKGGDYTPKTDSFVTNPADAMIILSEKYDAPKKKMNFFDYLDAAFDAADKRLISFQWFNKNYDYVIKLVEKDKKKKFSEIIGLK